MKKPELVCIDTAWNSERRNALMIHALTPIETAGKTFDPLYHDAVAMEQGGTQLEEVRRGWLFDGKVLRAASVRLGKPKE